MKSERQSAQRCIVNPFALPAAALDGDAHAGQGRGALGWFTLGSFPSQTPSSSRASSAARPDTE